MLENIISKIRNSTTIEKLLALNIFFFLILQFSKQFFISWFGLSSAYNGLFLKPWSLISYAFLHNNFFHLFSNLLILYYIGSLFNTFFPKKQLFYLYFYGILSAGLLFLLVGYFIHTNSVLVGASGAVTALFVAMATRIPYYQIRLFLFGDVKLWVLASIWVGISLIQLSTPNFGGAVAHLAGAIMGYLYVYFQLYDFDWNNFINFSSNNKSKKTHLKTVHKKTVKKEVVVNQEKQKNIDAILDKISKSGYDSLTNEEKAFLFNQGK